MRRSVVPGRLKMSSILLVAVLAFMSRAVSAESAAQPGNQSAGEGPGSEGAFAELDKIFVQNYNAVAGEMQKRARPMLVVNGFTFTLLAEDGTQKTTAGKIGRFDELKGVSHLGACMYAIAARHWMSPDDASWLDSMSACKQKIAEALAQVDSVNWSSDAWPGGETKLKQFIVQSLQIAQKFASDRIAAKSLTRAEYAKFAHDYTPTMKATFYLETLGGAYETLRILNTWKKDMGEEKWNRMYVVVAGSQGRTTAGLTRETNPSALFVSSLMEPESAAKHIIVAPAAMGMEQALHTAGMIITASDLADAMFDTAEAQRESGSFYKDLKSAEIPLALSNVKSVLQGLPAGTAKDPVLGLGPQK